MNFVLPILLNLSAISFPAEELNELCASFLNEFVYITPLPAEELNDLYAAFHANLCQSPAIPKKIYIEFHIIFNVLSCASSPLPKIGINCFVPNLWFVFCCKVGCSLLCIYLFYVMSIVCFI